MIHARELIEEADKLFASGGPWYVGRTDMQSYTGDGKPEHYAYLRHTSPRVRVRFLGESGDKALKDAIAFCKDAWPAKGQATIPDLEVVNYEAQPSGNSG